MISRHKKPKLFGSPDKKDSKGFWMTAYEKEGYTCVTRAHQLWEAIKSRCNDNVKSRNSSYKDVSIEFKDLQEFAEWCQTQNGYMNKDDKGRYWSIDKDILVPFSKVYSAKTCCFVPLRVNTAFTYRSQDRGPLPLGVTTDYGRGNCEILYRAYCCIGKQKPIGRMKTASEVHKLWQETKIKEILKLRDGMSSEVCFGLELHTKLILDDLDNSKETIR